MLGFERDRIKFGIAVKIGVLAFVLVLGAAVSVGVVFYAGTNAILVRHELRDLGENVRLEGIRLQSGIEALRQDVLFLSRTLPIQGIIRAREESDPKDNSAERVWRERLGKTFIEFLRAKPSYMQARYIGVAEAGREIVRVDRTGDAIVKVADEDLQPKAHRPYFQETIRLKAGVVYLSEITLNKEHGQIAKPHLPVIRTATPIYGPDGEAFGIVIINMDFGPLLKVTSASGRFRRYVTNNHGDFLVHPDSAKAFGFEFGTPFRIQEDYPQLANMFESLNSDPEFMGQHETESRNEAFHFIRVPFDPLLPERFLGLVRVAFYDEVVAESVAVRNRSIKLMLGLIAGTGVLAFVFSYLLTRRLQQIIQATKDFAAGVHDVSLPMNASDEIGVLSRAFQSMIHQVLERGKELRESEKRFRAIADYGYDWENWVGPEGQLIWVNPAVKRMTGYTVEECLAIPEFPLRLIHEDDREYVLKEYYQKAIEGSSGNDLPFRIKRKDGSNAWAAVSWQPIYDAKGVLLGHRSSIRDITKRK